MRYGGTWLIHKGTPRQHIRPKNSDIYKEYHRGRYKGRWFREGLYELLFDLQVRANEIGNQLARGLEWAAKTFFRSDDQRTIQNILTDIKERRHPQVSRHTSG